MEQVTDTTLYTFAISHFSEKIRWTLDYLKIPYREVQWTPFFHLPKASFKSKERTTVPILESKGKVIQDSTKIIFHLEQERGVLDLLPKDETLREEVLAIEERADKVGIHVIRYGYPPLLEHKKEFVEVWGWSSPWIEKTLLKTFFPIIKRLMIKGLNLSEPAQKKSAERVEEIMTWLDEQVADGRQFLVGGKLTIADITVASILAPIVMPPEHPLYSSSAYSVPLAHRREKYQDRPGFKWVRRLYAEYR